MRIVVAHETTVLRRLRSMILAASVTACVHSDPQPPVTSSAAGAPSATATAGRPSPPPQALPAPPPAIADAPVEPPVDRAPAPPPARPGAPVDLSGIGYEPVPCKTDHDCWFSRTPDLHPVRRPKNVRRKFRPCVDGEAAPECKQGRCGFGMPIPC